MSDRCTHRHAMVRFAVEAGLEPRAVALLQYIIEWADVVETPPTEVGNIWLLVPLGREAFDQLCQFEAELGEYGDDDERELEADLEPDVDDEDGHDVERVEYRDSMQPTVEHSDLSQWRRVA